VTRWHELRNAIKASNLPASDRAVFRARLDHSDYGTGELPAKFTRAQSAVAREVGITVRQVKRAEWHLARHGWLKVTGTTGPGKTRRYVLALGTDCTCTGRVHEPQRGTPTAATGDTMSPERGTPTGDTSQVNGRFPLRGNEREEERVPETITSNEKITPGKPEPEPVGFDVETQGPFWTLNRKPADPAAMQDLARRTRVTGADVAAGRRPEDQRTAAVCGWCGEPPETCDCWGCYVNDRNGCRRPVLANVSGAP